MMVLVPLFMFILGMLKFVMSQKSLLTSLILLEVMALATFSFINFLLWFNPSNSFIALVFIIIAVCDAVLGISIMLLSARISGNQLISNSVMSKW